MKEGSPAALSGVIKRGQRVCDKINFHTIPYHTIPHHTILQILSMNGENMEGASKKRVLDMMKSESAVTIDLQYDPESFSHYDDGAELKRIKAIVPKPKLAATPSVAADPVTVVWHGMAWYGMV